MAIWDTYLFIGAQRRTLALPCYSREMVAQAVDYSNLPAGAPPLGVKSNFDHAKSRAIDAHVTMGIFIVLTTIFVLLRVYVKLAVTHMWGWDDCKLSFFL